MPSLSVFLPKRLLWAKPIKTSRRIIWKFSTRLIFYWKIQILRWMYVFESLVWLGISILLEFVIFSFLFFTMSHSCSPFLLEKRYYTYICIRNSFSYRNEDFRKIFHSQSEKFPKPPPALPFTHFTTNHAHLRRSSQCSTTSVFPFPTCDSKNRYLIRKRIHKSNFYSAFTFNLFHCEKKKNIPSTRTKCRLKIGQNSVHRARSLVQ